MKAEGLQGARFQKWVTTTTRDADTQPSADRVQRQFVADAPNRLWVAEITYIPTWPDSCTWRWFWMRSAAESSAGRWPST